MKRVFFGTVVGAAGALALFALAALAAPAAPAALPDLRLGRLFEADSSGRGARFRFNLENIGAAPAEGVYYEARIIRFRGPGTGLLRRLDTVVGARRSVVAEFTTPIPLSAIKEVIITVNPSRAIRERFYGNNRAVTRLRTDLAVAKEYVIYQDESGNGYLDFALLNSGNTAAQSVRYQAVVFRRGAPALVRRGSVASVAPAAFVGASKKIMVEKFPLLTPVGRVTRVVVTADPGRALPHELTRGNNRRGLPVVRSKIRPLIAAESAESDVSVAPETAVSPSAAPAPVLPDFDLTVEEINALPDESGRARVVFALRNTGKTERLGEWRLRAEARGGGTEQTTGLTVLPPNKTVTETALVGVYSALAEVEIQLDYNQRYDELNETNNRAALTLAQSVKPESSPAPAPAPVAPVAAAPAPAPATSTPAARAPAPAPATSTPVAPAPAPAPAPVAAAKPLPAAGSAASLWSTAASGAVTPVAADTPLSASRESAAYAAFDGGVSVLDNRDGGSVKYEIKFPPFYQPAGGPKLFTDYSLNEVAALQTFNSGLIYKIDRLRRESAVLVADIFEGLGRCPDDRVRAPAVVQSASSNQAFFQTVGADVVYAITALECGRGATKNFVAAYRVADGQLLWRFNGDGDYAMGQSAGGCTLDAKNNRLYCVTQHEPSTWQNTIWAINTLDGTLRWAAGAGSTAAPPALLGDRVYTVSERGVAHAFSAADGAEWWSFTLNDTNSFWRPLAAARLGGGDAASLFAVDSGGIAYRLDDAGDTARLVWDEAASGARYVSAPAVAPLLGKVYIGRSDGRVAELNAGNGSVNASAASGAAGEALEMALTLDTDGEFADHNRLYARTADKLRSFAVPWNFGEQGAR